ncbi:C1 family peptidase [Saccharicrinis fermentans]|uniref:Aminopeptidase n=1 Tax=Saccharicrinis fermentans DSM 9555 = JCM 21142 TaxID=869213 RepID=W7YEW8_9BACT|nr:C1 family peptidase [Saccharicrinis fermentans]GAF02971.1 aminopeptidase C [Saccharicrinis fermentans DSM 9555 = JCM 21142]
MNNISAQEEQEEGYQFETIYDLEATPVKNQYRSGTCWSFSGLSFLESEAIKNGKGSFDLSEMFVVRNCYSDKATKYVRLHGSLNFGGGGSFEDVLYTLRNYGLVPEEVYTGLNYGESKHVHGEMDNLLKAYVDGVIQNKNKKLTSVWHKGFNGILDAYLGEYPESFTYKGKNYTPQTFAKEATGLNADDYIIVTSFTHHPYYSKFIFEVPDNWVWGEVYNVSLEDLKNIMHTTLEKGHTFGWASDVSEKGFTFRNGVAIVPESDIEEMDGSERSKWETMTKAEREKLMYSFKGPVSEKVITPEMRQAQFDNYLSTDDHGMHITGMVKDQEGTIYYKVKNSWDTNNKYDGYLYASESFVLLKTMNIMINKNTLPKDIKKKLGIK